MAEGPDPSEGSPDPELDPVWSPGCGGFPGRLEDVEVGRDVTLGTVSPAELSASDTTVVAGLPTDALVARLREGPVVERRRAALALAERDVGDDVIAALAAAVRTDGDAEVRQFAVEALAALGGDVSGRAAVETLVDDPDPWVRAEAVVALDRLDRARYADRVAVALDDDHHAVRRNAAISLFKHRGEALLPELLELLGDPSERVREWAAHLLGGVGDDRARDALERVVTSDERDLVRATARRSLEADPVRFRRRFAGAGDRDARRDGPDRLNRPPDL